MCPPEQPVRSSAATTASLSRACLSATPVVWTRARGHALCDAGMESRTSNSASYVANGTLDVTRNFRPSSNPSASRTASLAAHRGVDAARPSGLMLEAMCARRTLDRAYSTAGAMLDSINLESFSSSMNFCVRRRASRLPACYHSLEHFCSATRLQLYWSVQPRRLLVPAYVALVARFTSSCEGALHSTEQCGHVRSQPLSPSPCTVYARTWFDHAASCADVHVRSLTPFELSAGEDAPRDHAPRAEARQLLTPSVCCPSTSRTSSTRAGSNGTLTFSELSRRSTSSFLRVAQSGPACRVAYTADVTTARASQLCKPGRKSRDASDVLGIAPFQSETGVLVARGADVLQTVLNVTQLLLVVARHSRLSTSVNTAPTPRLGTQCSFVTSIVSLLLTPFTLPLRAPGNPNVDCAHVARFASRERTKEVTLNSWMTSCPLACTRDVAMYSHCGLSVDTRITATNGVAPRVTERNALAAVLARTIIPNNTPARSTWTRASDQPARASTGTITSLSLPLSPPSPVQPYCVPTVFSLFIGSPDLPGEYTSVLREKTLVGDGTAVQQRTKDAWFEVDVARGAQALAIAIVFNSTSHADRPTRSNPVTMFLSSTPSRVSSRPATVPTCLLGNAATCAEPVTRPLACSKRTIPSTYGHVRAAHSGLGVQPAPSIVPSPGEASERSPIWDIRVVRSAALNYFGASTASTTQSRSMPSVPSFASDVHSFSRAAPASLVASIPSPASSVSLSAVVHASLTSAYDLGGMCGRSRTYLMTSPAYLRISTCLWSSLSRGDTASGTIIPSARISGIGMYDFRRLSTQAADLMHSIRCEGSPIVERYTPLATRPPYSSSVYTSSRTPSPGHADFVLAPAELSLESRTRDGQLETTLGCLRISTQSRPLLGPATALVPFVLPLESESVQLGHTSTEHASREADVEPGFRINPKHSNRWIPSFTGASSKALQYPGSRIGAPSLLSVLIPSAIPKFCNCNGHVGEWHIASVKADLTSRGGAGASATTLHVVIRLVHAFSARGSRAIKQISYQVLKSSRSSTIVAVGSQRSYSRIKRALLPLQGDSENTPLHVKLNVLAGLMEKLGSAAGAFMFTVLMIKFFTRLGRSPHRIRSEKASIFVGILIIAITLIVVAMSDGPPLAVTIAPAFAVKHMMDLNQDLEKGEGKEGYALSIIFTEPSSTERKAMSAAVRLSDNLYRFYVKGASEILTKLCSTHVVVAKPGETPSQDDHIETKDIGQLAHDSIQRTISSYANQSLRTITLCYRDLTAALPHAVNPEAREDQYSGRAKDLSSSTNIGVDTPLQPGIRNAIEECMKAGVSFNVEKCTRDNALTAHSIVVLCGIFTLTKWTSTTVHGKRRTRLRFLPTQAKQVVSPAATESAPCTLPYPFVSTRLRRTVWGHSTRPSSPNGGRVCRAARASQIACHAWLHAPRDDELT